MPKSFENLSSGEILPNLVTLIVTKLAGESFSALSPGRSTCLYLSTFLKCLSFFVNGKK